MRMFPVTRIYIFIINWFWIWAIFKYYKLYCYNAGDILTWRRNYGAKKKCGDFDYHSGCGVGRPWRLCAATVVQESSSKSVNAANQVPVTEIPVTCNQVNLHLFCWNLWCHVVRIVWNRKLDLIGLYSLESVVNETIVNLNSQGLVFVHLR